MNIIHGVLSGDSYRKKHILYTSCDNKIINDTIQSLDYNLIRFEHIYFGYNMPNLIICNNKAITSDACRDLSIRYHIPVLVVDHDVKNPTVITEKIENTINVGFSSGLSVAINERVAQSWSCDYDYVLNEKDHTDLTKWNNIINEAIQKVFIYYGQ